METTITITTIHKPTFIEELCENINKYDHKDVEILIIGDLKTPSIKDYCEEISKKFNVPIIYMDIEAQENSLSDFQSLLNLFPYNTPDRVILGGMIAYLRGSERIIAVDDDNFVTENDFVGFHSITGDTRDIDLIQQSTLGWFNVHSMLYEMQNIPFYPRGFPFGKRETMANIGKKTQGIKKIIVNQGLVLGDPDIDAITRLANPINATRLFPGGKHFGLYKTWSPFNYQNTSLCRELIPCYYRPLSGLRNADIWTSYLFNKLAEHFGDVITFGQPLVKQIRNKHNLWEDLDLELENNKETDYFVELLKSVNLTEKTYFNALGELINRVEVEDKYPMARDFFKEYKVWWDVVSEII